MHVSNLGERDLVSKRQDIAEVNALTLQLCGVSSAEQKRLDWLRWDCERVPRLFVAVCRTLAFYPR